MMESWVASHTDSRGPSGLMQAQRRPVLGKEYNIFNIMTCAETKFD